MTDHAYIVAVDPHGEYYVMQTLVHRLGPYATAAEANRVRDELNATATRSAH